ncbi:FeoB-associated Cys-rich membrane protein [Lacinutrix sp. C3R15]|nr:MULTISPECIES: FeoB-associated Cys-rich membrane protein [Flavobacteriaceae]MBU2938157.1 FeoB-associated Cys-rich membrane protein [Lacinutrix sp. C3R15]MDO6621471.1 FeoB-associated Cys-rich membrane protein [Oceanihabitans sp. 1_MG-2023]
MNTIIQNILAFSAVLLAVGFLVRKYFYKKKTKKACGTDDCGCH